MKQDAFQSAIDALMDAGTPRVWSLIVTVFGDLAQNPGETISGPVLSNVLTPLGIKPEAMRVALHRLRNEGWLVARKQGRTSHHQLEQRGQNLSAEASIRIYQRSARSTGDWHILCLPGSQTAPEGWSAADMSACMRLAPGVYLANKDVAKAPGNALVFKATPENVPRWVMDDSLPRGLISDLKDLHAALEIFVAELADSGDATPLQAACLRVLIVHRWRRLVLKVPDVQDALFGEDWIGAQCRNAVHQALDRLPRPKLSDLA